MPKPGQLTKYGVILFIAFQLLIAARLVFLVGYDFLANADDVVTAVFGALNVVITILFMPLFLLANLAVFIDYHLSLDFIGLYENFGFPSRFVFHTTNLAVGSLLLLSTIDYLCVPDKTGVPRLYRFFALFSRPPNPIKDDVRRAGASEGARTFDGRRFNERQDRARGNAYDEALEREELEAALQEAEKAKQRLSEEERRRQEREAQRRQAAKDLAEKMEEVERLKARVDELKRKD